MKKIHITFLIGTLCTISGLLLGAPFLGNYLAGSVSVNTGVPVVDTSEPVETPEPRISGTPTHIEFPERGVSVDVVPGYYNAKSKSWTLSEHAAHFATVTAEPNNKTGNTFIYGHNMPKVFAPLVNSALGDTAIVTTANGHVFTYKLVAIRDVEPNDTSAIQDHGSPILTVQTCSGVWFENRRMFTYELSEAR